MKRYIVEEVAQENLIRYNVYFELRKKLVDFFNCTTIYNFKFIFEEDYQRLWEHFVVTCDRNLDKFTTYLTQEQRNLLYVNIFENEIFYSLNS